MTRARDLAKGTFSGDLTVDTNTLVVDSANNSVGIGTSSPSGSGLHIKKDTSATTNELLRLSNSAGSTTDGVKIVMEVANTAGNGGEIGTVRDGGSYNPYMYFSTSSGVGSAPIERMRITSSGSFQLSPASNQGTFRFGNQQGDGSGNGAQFYLDDTQSIWYNSTTSTADKYHAQFRNPNGLVGHIKTNGSATSYNTSSDYRLKTDAQPMTGASARVQALKPVNFEWISDGTRVDGFLAHEAQAIVPESVTGTKDAMRDEEYEVTAAVYEDIIIAAVLDEEGNELEAERTEQRLVSEAVMGTRSVPDMQGIDQSKLVPLLTAALQEALNKIEAMETRLAALEAN
jgi:hypothetical protein